MLQQFQEKTNQNVSYSYFSNFFRENFNLKIGYLQIDTCSTCEHFHVSISKENNLIKKTHLQGLQSDHLKEADFFYTSYRNIKPNIVTITMDMMSNQFLPRTNIGESYFSSKFLSYIFGLTTTTPEKESTDFFLWNENDGDKGASNIISCLNNYMQPLINKYTKFNIFCDGCGGQNKNKFLIYYLSNLAYKNNIKIRINFLVTGHSFMPIDRSFGRVKKLIKRKDPIISINEYYSLFSEVGKVWEYRKDFVFSNWKLFHKNIKINKSLQIRNLRQI